MGLAVLLLTLGGGYVVAHRGIVPASVNFLPVTADADVSDDDADEPRPAPTTAEILEHIEAVSARHRVPPRLVAAIVAVESSFNPRAVSNRGAQGLMQLMPATAAQLDVQDSFDMQENLDGGVRHLRVLMDRFNNDLPLVLAAYNAGDRAVLSYRGVPPYPQTRRYVIRVLRRYDPAAARAAANRIYPAARKSVGPVAPRPVPPLPPTVVAPPPSPPTRLVSLDWPPPPKRPLALGPWRETLVPRTDAVSVHGTDSP